MREKLLLKLIKGEVLYEGNSSGQHQITRLGEGNLGELFQTYYTKRILDKTPKVSEKIDKALDYININDPNAREFGKYFGSWWAKDNIPIVKDINIIGVDIPEIGTEEVILYISEDGKNWDKRVRFIVKEGEEPQFKKIEPNRW